MPNVLLLSERSKAASVAGPVAAIARHGSVETITLHDHPAAAVLRDLPLVRSAVARNEVAHAFGTTALTLAVTAGADSIVYSPTRWPNKASIAWLRATMAYRTIHVICDSDTLRRAYVTRGIPANQCTIVRPGVSMGGVSGMRDDALRARLGFKPDDRVIFAPLPIDATNDYSLTVWSASLFNVLNPHNRLLLSGQDDQNGVLGRVRARFLDQRLMVIAEKVAPEADLRALYSAADLVLLTPAKHANSADIVTAMTSMRPIVATVTPHVCEFLEDRHTALLAKQATPRMVATRLMDAFDDPVMMRTLADQARAEAYEYFTVSKMLEALDAVYARSYSTTMPARSKPRPA